MEHTSNEKSFLERLQSGEDVTCEECNKGIYTPFGGDCKTTHAFTCDNCGSRYHWDPVIDID